MLIYKLSLLKGVFFVKKYLILIVIINIFIGSLVSFSNSENAVDVYQSNINRKARKEKKNRKETIESVQAPTLDFDGDSRPIKPVLKSIYDSKKVNWKIVLMTGDNSIMAFDNARGKLYKIFQDLGVSKKNIKQLSRDYRKVNKKIRFTSINNFEKSLKELKIKEGDGCLIHMTSHGSPRGFFIRSQGFLTPNKLNQLLDKYCLNTPTIVLVSACYSGIFTQKNMVKQNRIILTAARHDRTSFGCGPEDIYTYWDGCLINNIYESDTWNKLSNRISKCIYKKESKGGFRSSYPQSYIGEDMINLDILYKKLKKKKKIITISKPDNKEKN